MSEQRWTAPQAGWYRVGHGGEPEFLGVDPPAIEEPGHAEAVHLGEGGFVMTSTAVLPAPAAGVLRVPWER